MVSAMRRAAATLVVLAVSACGRVPPLEPKTAMSISIRVSENAEVATVKVNGVERGKTPLDLDVPALPFDPTLLIERWPPPGATVFSPTEAQVGQTKSSLALALGGDILYVRTQVGEKETRGAIRLTVTGADGRSLDFDTAEKSVGSGLGKAEHSVRIWFRRRK
jgi:hypothetical protein